MKRRRQAFPRRPHARDIREREASTAGKLCMDVGFWGGVVPGNATELRPLWERGVFGFKCFLVPSGVEEFVYVAERDLRGALPELSALKQPLLVHGELPGPIAEAEKKLTKDDPRRYSAWLASRPRAAAHKA